MPAAGGVVFSASHLFAEHTSQMSWFHQDSESYSWWDRQQTTKQLPWFFFGVSGFGKCFGSLSTVQPLNWLSSVENPLFVAYHSPIRKWFIVVEYNKRRWHSQTTIFFIWGIHLLCFFTFPICFECQRTIKWSTLSSSPASHVVRFKRISFDDPLDWCCQIPMAGWPLCSLSSRFSSPLQNFLKKNQAFVNKKRT